jgi:hypothetical protein
MGAVRRGDIRAAYPNSMIEDILGFRPGMYYIRIMSKKTKKSAANREYKDTVFRKLFSSNAKYLVEVYNAIFDAHYAEDTDVVIRTLESVIRGGGRNDLAFELGGTTVVLIEHQTTINVNLPLRILFYIVEIYAAMIENKMLHRPDPVPLPYPVFVILYNGDKPLKGGRSTLRLSDLFIQHGAEPPEGSLELVVQVYDINHGHNPAIEERSRILKEYAQFVAISRDFRKTMDLDEAIVRTVEECIKRGILKEFFEQHKTEVMSMLTSEWSHDQELEVREEVATEQAMKKVARALLARGDDANSVAEVTDLTIDDVLRLQSE